MKRIGTAGWTIPAGSREQFPLDGTQLERYASRLNCAEINSSFYRAHRPATYARWAASVPESFSFAVKVPKEITHTRRCVDCGDELKRFLDETAELGPKRGVMLFQFPPSFAYDPKTIHEFFAFLRGVYDGFAVCEPRHASWFTGEADDALKEYRIGRVAADPAISEMAAVPGGWTGIVYYRQHGSPRTYYSRYEQPAIDGLAARLEQCSAAECWTIFDNTGAGAALENALDLMRAV